MARNELTLDEFFDDVESRGRGDIVDWREEGKTTGAFHPELRIFYKRKKHFVPVVGDDGKIAVKVFNCPNVEKDDDLCPICRARQALRDDDTIDNDEIVFIAGDGRYKDERCKGEVINVKGYDWQKNLGWKTEYLVAWVEPGQENDTAGICPMPLDCAKKLKKEIKGRIEELGDKGNPFDYPCCFRLEYDKKAAPSQKYSASVSSVEVDEEMLAIMENDPPNIEGLVAPSDPYEVYEAVIDSFVVDFGDLFADFEDGSVAPKSEEKEEKAEPEKKEKRKVGGKKETKKAPAKKAAPKTRKTRTTKKKEEPEPEPEKKAPKRRVAKKKEEPKPEPEPTEEEAGESPCPECGEMAPDDATNCPHCGAEFEYIEDEDPFAE